MNLNGVEDASYLSMAKLKKNKFEIENPKSEISRARSKGLKYAYPLNNRFGTSGYSNKIKAPR